MTTTKTPMTPEEMLIYLRHLAKGDGDIEETIFKVKMSQTWDQSFKSLNDQSRDKLAKTFAWLRNEDTNHEDIAKLTKDGLRVMVLHRLQELMPELCQTCHNNNFYDRTDQPMVCCVRCNKGACKECYPSNPGAGRSFFYLCVTCEKFVSTNVGDKALTANHLLKKPKVAKKKKETVQETNMDEATPDETTTDEISSSCPFTADVDEETESDKNNNNPDVSVSLFPPPAPPRQETEPELEQEQLTLEKPIKCPECDYKSSNKKEMESHIKKEHGDAILSYYKCPKCRYQSTDREEVRKHQEEKHEHAAANVTVNVEDEDGFEKQASRGFKKTDEVKKTKPDEIKDKVCPYLKKGHCKYSLSGRKPYDGVAQCPFFHPKTCPKLLNNGNKGKYGCDGSKCGMVHPKMCPVSLKFEKCVQDCTKGYHVRRNSKMMMEKKKEEEKAREQNKKKDRRVEEESERTRKQIHLSRNPNTTQWSVPPPPIQDGQSEADKAAFLGHIRREVLNILQALASAPVGQAPVGQAPTQVLVPSQTQVLAPSPTPAPPTLSWAEAVMRLR